MKKLYHLLHAHLNVVVSVVVQVEHPVQFGVTCYVQVLRCLQTFTDGLSCILLHLDIVEFSVKKKGDTLDKVKKAKERTSVLK